MRILSTLLWLSMASTALAQNGPPFFGSGTAYDPQVSTINSGALLDAQAVVSDDRKHVTLNLRPSQSKLQSLIRVPVVTSSGGYVGGAVFSNDPPATPTAAKQNLVVRQLQTSPAAIERTANAWMLTRQGIFFVQPLK